MNKEYEFLTRENERWQRRNLSRALAVLIAFLSIVVLFTGWARSQTPERKITIGILLSGDYKPIETEIRSYLARELRSLGDVEIVEAGGDFDLQIILLKTETKGGTFTGYTVSMSVTEFVICAGKVHELFVTAFLHTAGKDDLRKLCEGLITSFDSTVMEKRRKRKGVSKSYNTHDFTNHVSSSMQSVKQT